jgi:hypothetical protein
MAKPSARPIDPRDMPAIWPTIEARVLKLMADRPKMLDRLRTALLAGTAWLYLVETGFFAITIYFNPDEMRNELFCWCAIGTGRGNIRRHEETLVRLAQLAGAEAVVTRSERPGMGRALGQRWRARHTEFVLEIQR